MSFLSDVQEFSKESLKKTETNITTQDGRRLLETKDENGRIKTEVLVGREYGFVGDYKPDLQVAEIRPGLLMGSQDVAADFDLLNKSKVTHILNVATGVENTFPETFTYKTVNILDIPEADITTYFDECFSFINECKKTENGVIFIHCNAGVSRSASIVVGYLMKTESMKFLDALFYVKGVRTTVCPNSGFVEQLRNYELLLTKK